MLNDYKYCYVLDYSDGKIYCFKLTDSPRDISSYETTDDVVSDWGFDLDEVEYMFTKEKSDINFINKPFNQFGYDRSND